MKKLVLALIVIGLATNLLLFIPQTAEAAATYNVQANVFTDNPDGSNNTEVPNATFQTPCDNVTSVVPGTSINSSQVVSPAPYNADYYYAHVASGSEYCMALTGSKYSSNQYIPGFDGPFTRPWNYSDGNGGWEDNYPSATTNVNIPSCNGPFDLSNYQDHCSTFNYQCQVASKYASPDACGYKDEDRGTDAGIDFDYVSLSEWCPPTNSNCSTNTNAFSPTCSLTPSTTTPSAGQPFTLTYTIKNNAAETPLTFTSAANTPYLTSFGGTSGTGLTLSGPPNGTSINAGSTYTSSNFTSTGAGTGTYQITMEVEADNIYGPSSTTELANCSTSISVSGFYPYFKVFGGNVTAGENSDDMTSCLATSAGINSWNQGNTGKGGLGAGTTTAALATGSISGFDSGQNILNMLNPPPLTFANTPISQYGGSYGTGGTCGSSEDYYSWAESMPFAEPCTSLYPTLNIPQTSLGINQHILCYSTSNVTISGNITYNIPSGTPVSEYPSFELVVKGANIDITSPFNASPGVTNLYGAYIAEYGTINDTNGNIDMCAAGTADSADNTCAGDRLVINGSFTADNVDLYRNYGTLSAASNASTPPDQYAAEEFDYYPYNWLLPGNTSKLNVQSVTSLPPVL